MNLRKTTLALAISAVTMPALALSPSVGDPGFSGHVNLGIGGGKVESNFLAEVAGTDLSDDKLKSIGDPDDKSVTMPVIGYDLGWTFSGGKTRVFLAADDAGDTLDFDPATQIGIRYDSDNAGNFQVVGLMSSTMTRVYEDPYQVGSKRGQSEVTSNGGRFTWDKMFGSNFELIASARKIDVDKERSGEQAFSSNAAARKLLERDGDVYRASLSYLYKVNDRHAFRPSIGYVDHDLDGDAMSKKGGLIGLGYSYETDGFNLSVMGEYGDFDGDKANPFATANGRRKKNNTEHYSLAGAMEFPGLFGLENWIPNISAIYANDDSDVDFNDTQAWIIGAAMYRSF